MIRCRFQCWCWQFGGRENGDTEGTEVMKVKHRWSAVHGHRATVRRVIVSPSSFRTATVNNILVSSCVTCIHFFSGRCSTTPSTLSSRSDALRCRRLLAIIRDMFYYNMLFFICCISMNTKRLDNIFTHATTVFQRLVACFSSCINCNLRALIGVS